MVAFQSLVYLTATAWKTKSKRSNATAARMAWRNGRDTRYRGKAESNGVKVPVGTL